MKSASWGIIASACAVLAAVAMLLKPSEWQAIDNLTALISAFIAATPPPVWIGNGCIFLCGVMLSGVIGLIEIERYRLKNLKFELAYLALWDNTISGIENKNRQISQLEKENAELRAMALPVRNNSIIPSSISHRSARPLGASGETSGVQNSTGARDPEATLTDEKDIKGMPRRGAGGRFIRNAN